jgi:SAM-dependent methyltransferase
MMQAYFKSLYRRTMRDAYATALKEVVSALTGGGRCLDCGAQGGQSYDAICREIPFSSENYFGIEWNHASIRPGRQRGLSIIRGNLNDPLPYRDRSFACVFALSVLEHLTNGCRFILECRRVLQPHGQLILLTPNISTFFSIVQLLLGKMPSSGPHPDSSLLVANEKPIQVSDNGPTDVEDAFPLHRHMVVFSYRVLKRYLRMVGFSDVKGFGFGLYPFPNSMQTVLERIDPYHCHQMVMVARK